MSLTLGQFIQQAITKLAASPTPRVDAEALVMHVTGLTRSRLITHATDPLTAEQQLRLAELLTRRAHGEPIAYLTGTREFWSLELTVTPDVLIPRPETELLVEQALERIPHEVAWTIADLGTGSGAVALAIATERPRCRVIATDASAAALAVARANTVRLAIANVEFRHGEWLDPLADAALNLIVSNPPYIADHDPHLAQGDVRFEPHVALVSGEDGMDAIRRIVGECRDHLVPGGWLLLEHGANQHAAVAEMLRARGYVGIGGCRDLAGHERVTAGRRPGL